ncbi:TonB-dependent receptor [Prolixibacteraceae bacterium JC049]|nr:TonB-dependent receptor [Prolixibacteraceae bacterium JC049]
MRSILFLIILTLFSQVNYAQKKNNDAVIVGHVVSKGEHVSFVNITIDGTTIGTGTDATGHYSLTNVPLGDLTIRVSGIGYKSQAKSISIKANETIEINFDIEEDMLNLESVVVTADRNQTNRAEAPVVVTTISPKLMNMTQSVNIAEGLSFTPGLRTETDCQNCGFTQLRMNGLQGPYTQILMNSRPVFSGLAGVYGLELIPANMVQRMEVVRGGGSALFGGNAIAGTVNIITKEPIHNTFNMDSRIGIIGVGGKDNTDPSVDKQVNMNASIISDDKKTGGYVYTMLRNRDAHDINGDDFSELVEMENTTFGFSAFHKPTAKSKISLDGYRISEFRRGGNKLNKLPHEADIAEQLDHLITGANLSYDLFTNGEYDKVSIYASAQDVKRDSYYGAERDPNAYGDTKNLTTSTGANYSFHSNHFLFAPSNTIVGIDNTIDYLKDVKLGANGKTNTTLTRQTVNTLGTFLQHDWKAKKLNVSVGLRYDRYWITDHESDNNKSLNNGVLVPRASILYKYSPNLRFRLGYAQGYRAPQVFNEDLHIELVNATRVETFNSPDLKQETSNSITASINSVFSLGKTYNDFLIESFYTKLNDPFANEFHATDDKGNFAYKRINAQSGAYVAGVNLEWKSFVSAKLETQMGFTIQQSRYEDAQAWGEDKTSKSKDFMRTPDHYGYATFIYKPTHNFNATLSLNYTGSMKVPHFGVNPDDIKEQQKKQTVLAAIQRGDIIQHETLATSKEFLVTDLLFSYHMHITKETGVKFYIGVKNLFNQLQDDHDKGQFRDAGYIYGPAMPRTINFGVKFGNIL